MNVYEVYYSAESMPHYVRAESISEAVSIWRNRLEDGEEHAEPATVKFLGPLVERSNRS